LFDQQSCTATEWKIRNNSDRNNPSGAIDGCPTFEYNFVNWGDIPQDLIHHFANKRQRVIRWNPLRRLRESALGNTPIRKPALVQWPALRSAFTHALVTHREGPRLDFAETAHSHALLGKVAD